MVGRACATCPRGVFASRDLSAGDVVMAVPMRLALPMRLPTPNSLRTAAEYAQDLLARMHTDANFNATWGVYWASMPRVEDTLGFELFTDEQLDMLQSPPVVSRGPLACHCRACVLA